MKADRARKKASLSLVTENSAIDDSIVSNGIKNDATIVSDQGDTTITSMGRSVRYDVYWKFGAQAKTIP
jgi:hypothetical protein